MPVLNSAAARLGQALRETQDVLQRDNLEATASVVNSVNGVNGDVPSEMTADDVSDIVTTFQNNDAEYVTSIIGAADKFGTASVGDAYACLCTTKMIPVLEAMDGFVTKYRYPDISKTLSCEWGAIRNMRFYVSSQGSVSANASMNNADVANCFIVAKEAYKVVWQAGGKAKFIYLPPGYNNDPCLKRNEHVKSEVIDLETYDYAEAA